MDKNIFIEKGKNLKQKFIDNLRQYQNVKSDPLLSKKSFKDLMESFIAGYGKNRNQKK